MPGRRDVKPPERPRPTPVSAATRWPAAALLVAAVAVAYLPALRAGFVGWDDPLYVSRNACVTRADGPLISWTRNCGAEQYGAPPAWTDNNPGYYPITLATFWVEWRAAAKAPWLFHVDNVALHAANALLVWRLAGELGMPAPFGWLVAAVWALHPVQVESVAWITERKNTLYVFFYLLALLLFVRARSTTAHLLALGALALALLSKATAMTLPAVLVPLAWARGTSLRDRRFWAWLAAFAALSLAAGLVLLTQRPAGISVPPLATRLTLPPRVAWFYVHQFLWPAHLVPIYPRWPLHGFGASDALAWLAVAVVVAVTAAAWQRQQIPRPVLFGAAFFVANLSLVAGITWFSYYDYSLVADHFAYLPTLGLAFATLGWLASPTVAGRGRLVTAATVALGVACVALGVRTFTQVPAWNDTQTLWEYTLARNPTCYQCEYNLALDLEEHGDAERAATHYERSLDLHPDAEAAINLGNIRVTQGRNDEAQALYRRAVELDPANPAGHYNLAMMLGAQGDLDGAVREDGAAIAIVPRHIGARMARGDALLRLDRAADAEKDFQAVLTTNPEDPDALTGLGRVAIAREDWPGALTQLEKALRQRPRADLHRMLAEVLEQLDRNDDAVAHYRAASEAEPGNADGVTALVSALLATGRVAEAVALLHRRVADTPDEPAFATSLAWIEATARDAQWRNAAEAVRLAERACPADDCDDPDRLDTLAAAYAEAARFDDAIRTAARAVTAARASEADADGMEERLALYRARQPYRSPW